MKKALFLLFAVSVSAFLFQSCKKENLTDQTAAITAEDIMAHTDLSEQVDVDADIAIDGFMSDDVDDRNDCPTVTFAQPKGTWPNTITLDYSDDGCTKDGRTYKGKIVINQSAAMNTTGANRTISFENFYVEGVKIEGTKSVTNGGLNASNQPFFNVSVNETHTYPDGTQGTFTSERVRTMVEGYDTPVVRADDKWSITGNGSGVNRNGVAYTTTITNPLIKRYTCPWITQGTIEFTADSETRTLDLGDGSCDQKATLTLPDGTVVNVKVRHHWWK